ncbi:MotA/TolQ/ExbB proton channel family protein [Methylothermus subterraneus]
MVDSLLALFYRGGPLLWAILLASVGMWYLIFAGFDRLMRELPKIQAELNARWRARKRSRVGGEVCRLGLLALAESRLKSGLFLLEALVQVLPLLGLLGTVSGMIKVFTVLTVFGTGNARALASGISEALITTLAGLVTALSGLYLIGYLKGRIQAALARLSLLLS